MRKLNVYESENYEYLQINISFVCLNGIVFLVQGVLNLRDNFISLILC